MLPVESLVVERQGRTIHLKKTEHSDSLNIQFSIVNIQFRLVRVRVPKNDMKINIEICPAIYSLYLIFYFVSLCLCGDFFGFNFSGLSGLGALQPQLSDALDIAWMRLERTQMDKWCQQSERTDHKDTEGPGAFC